MFIRVTLAGSFEPRIVNTDWISQVDPSSVGKGTSIRLASSTGTSGMNVIESFDDISKWLDAFHPQER